MEVTDGALDVILALGVQAAYGNRGQRIQATVKGPACSISCQKAPVRLM